MQEILKGKYGDGDDLGDINIDTLLPLDDEPSYPMIQALIAGICWESINYPLGNDRPGCSEAMVVQGGISHPDAEKPVARTKLSLSMTDKYRRILLQSTCNMICRWSCVYDVLKIYIMM